MPYSSSLLVLQEWLDKILDGSKTMEVRSRRLKGGIYYLGCKGVLYGQALLGDAVHIDNPAKMKALKKKHLLGDVLPYKTTYGLPILGVRKLHCKYQHKRGAIGLIRFKACTATDEAAAGSESSPGLDVE